ncbi:hypothetical protein NC797_06790 [Aquibacillus sp. 3ASR75-11]|uniref:Uncharacterized protein n=1 Tax=Terrihalobacillus insolitus TaxID=2950438 RepID=A0A9X3WSU7_9BACI|nr:hypothetical protein [Terrihalobacillus insolitus]MDC3424213.1 hypothetical protein [Terrihalobacillus insolitus]
MLENSTIDPFKLLIVSLGSADTTYIDIDSVYKKREDEYYRLYKESEYYNDPLFLSFTTENSEVMKKSIGIILWEKEREQDIITLSLIKKTHRFTYNYVKQKGEIDIGQYAEFLYDRFNKPGDTFRMRYHFAVFVYLCVHFKKVFDTFSPFAQHLMMYLKMIENSFEESFIGISDDYRKYKVKIEKDKQVLGIHNSGILRASEYFDRQIWNEHNNFEDETRTETELKVLDQNYMQEYKEQLFSRLTKRNGESRYLVAHNNLLRYFGLDGRNLLESTKLTKSDVNSIYANLYSSLEEGVISEDEKALLTSSSFLLAALINEYKNTRERYFEQLKDSFYYEIDKMKKDLVKEKESLKAKREELKKQKQEFLTTNKELTKNLKVLQEELNKHKKSLMVKEGENKRTKKGSKRVERAKRTLI